ncbi:hypothetical protein CY34DRAFT_814269 [Suillus luteus UH-Slu-Lm8-n1]|uniref:Uncharacterized protein n=1 Tax=Suillus luteus UH-Slu-Lm8-n1 TaxID=930992 RepID=A0A0D0A2R4_9AGAM|nr:hypothetical protein CY34DRAFT_814269 [Suillus luteus UH-Slu-Lm8-n1]
MHTASFAQPLSLTHSVLNPGIQPCDECASAYSAMPAILLPGNPPIDIPHFKIQDHMMEPGWRQFQVRILTNTVQ